MKKIWVISLLMSGLLSLAQSQKRQDYIEKYKDLAIEEMRSFGIPASIKMAQAILESGDGQSKLAQEANNHFGIKCHLDWNGGKVYFDDDAEDECFRKYKKVADSYRDHSLFLKERSRYSLLFTLDPKDYKGWAKGLKQAGYATNPRYPELLIKLIEENELYKLDLEDDVNATTLVQRAYLYHPNRIKYVIVEKGDSFEKIAKDFNTTVKRLLDYNEVNYTHVLEEGDYVFLQPKRKKAKVRTHKVEEGETLYQISQKYGIKLKDLYKKNKFLVGTQAVAGDILYLRKRIK